MAKGMTLGKAYVQIVPSAEGIKGSLESVMNSEGINSGKSFSSAFSKAAVAGISAAAIGKAISASITEGAALEQSLGGVETLFKDNADKVITYADQAYKTAGVSANAYMEQVTSFSATLLQGLGGDTAKAAEYANTAMVDMSDNANKFGTDIQSIQNAYQGFARQNYVLLDNLKLGYGGSQAEMARLINDSGVLGDSIKVTAETVKDVPFSDVITAIHTIQSNLGVTGTTAKEAATTFSGSMQSMQSAASNLLGHLSTGTGEIDEDVKVLEDTAVTFGGNLVGMLSKINKGLSESEGAVGDVYATAKGLAVALAALKIASIAKDIGSVNGGLSQLSSILKSINASQVAITAVAVGATYLARQIDKATAAIDEAADSYDLLNDKQKAYVDGVESLAKVVGESSKKNEQSISDAEAQAAAYSSMRDKLYELDNAQVISNESRAEMQSLVSQLNNSVPGLNLLIDEGTGHLVGQRKAIDDIIDSYAKRAKAQAAEESLVEAYKQQYDAEKNLEEAENNRLNAYTKYSDALSKRTKLMWEYNAIHNKQTTATYDEQLAEQELLKQIEALDKEISESKNIMGEMDTAFITSKETARKVNGEISDLNGIIKENSTATDAAAGSLDNYGKAAGNATQAVSKTFTVSQESFDKISEIAQTYADAANNIDETTKGIADSLDIFSAFNWDDELNADEMISNLESNLNAMDWGTNGVNDLKEHADELGVAINDNLLAKLEEMGPDAANQLRTMCNMSESELQQYSDLYGKYYAMAQEKATNELEKLKDESAMQLREIMGQAEHQAVPLTDMYNYLAECAVSGFEGGVIGSTDALKAAGREIFFAVEEGYKEASETNSPSRAMRRLGKFLPEGAALGIEDGTDIVRVSAANMAKAAISSAEPFRASAPATDIDIGTVRRAAAQYDYSGTQAAVSGKADSGKPAVINLNINGQTFAQATADFIDLANGATLALKERGVAR
ncbi:MAG: hypothetical protein KIG32_07370 [Ruminiclostridium sp.]|nr:hypothetical protein [Ruminiclostridium sp.]